MLAKLAGNVTPEIEPTEPVTLPTEPDKLPVMLPVILAVVAALLPAMKTPFAAPGAAYGNEYDVRPAQTIPLSVTPSTVALTRTWSKSLSAVVGRVTLNL